MKSIFITFTPYHLQLSACITKNCESATLVHVKDGKTDFLLDAFKKVELFTDIVELPSPFSSDNYFSETAKKQNCKKILSDISIKQKELDIYCFHDARVESQFIMEYCKKNARVNNCIYVEDGTQSYINATRTEESRLSWLFQTLYHGMWREKIVCLGTSSWIDEGKFIYPDSVRDELSHLPSSKIRMEEFRSLKNDQWFRLFWDSYPEEQDSIPDSDLFLLLDHSDIINNYYMSKIENVVESALSKGKKICYKYHPRETDYEFIGLSDYSNTEEISSGIPAESIYLLYDEFEAVIGGKTGALLTGTWLLPSTNFYTIYPNDPYVEVFMKKGGMPISMVDLTS